MGRLDIVLIGRYLALLLVAWLPFTGGPRLPCLFLGLHGLWVMSRAGRSLYAQSAQRRLRNVFGLLWFPVLLSVPGSLAVKDSLAVLAVLPLYYLVGISLTHSLTEATNREWLNKWVGIVVLIWTLDGLIQYLFGKDLLLIPLSLDGRVVGFFAGNLRLSLYLSVLLPMLMTWILNRNQALAGAVFLLVAIAIILSGARASWLMAAIVGFFLIHRLRFRFKWPLVAASILVMVAVASSSHVVDEKVAQTVTIKHIDFHDLDYLLGYRLTIWNTALRMLQDRPLTGVGALAFDEAYDRYSQSPDDPFRTGGWYPGGVWHAHQLYISIAAETGWIGLLSFVAIIVLSVYWYRNTPPEGRRLSWPYMVGLMSAVFPLNSQPLLYKNWWFPILLLLYCLFLTSLQGRGAIGSDMDTVEKQSSV